MPVRPKYLHFFLAAGEYPDRLLGLGELLAVCTDPEGFTRKVNEELKLIWQQSTGHDPSARHRLCDIEARIENIRRSIEDGMPDAKWAYQRMQDLMDERERLRESAAVAGSPPQIDSRTALAYRRQTETLLAAGTPAERKQLIRAAVDQITLAQDTLEVEITYKIPEAIGEYSGSGGALCQVAPTVLATWMVRRYRLKSKRRHTPL